MISWCDGAKEKENEEKMEQGEHSMELVFYPWLEQGVSTKLNGIDCLEWDFCFGNGLLELGKTKFRPFRKGFVSTASSGVTQASPRPLKLVPRGDERCPDPRSPMVLRLGRTCQDTWRWSRCLSHPLL